MATRSRGPARKGSGAVFRRIATSLPEAVESAHMNHPDFRVGGRIFSTLFYPDESWGMVRLPPETQQEFVRDYPAVFVPVKGAWGRQGATGVCLEAADEETLGRAITTAFQYAVRQGPTRKKRA